MRAFCPRTHKRGSALIEMAFILPVLILLFTGMVELCRYAMMLGRVDAVSNSLAGALYGIKSQELGDMSSIYRVMDQAAAIASPDPTPTVTVRFCDWQSDDGASPELNRVNLQFRPNQGGAACERTGPKCSSGATANGHGAFVQVYSCNTFRPIIVGGIFQIFHETVAIESLSYIPLTNANLTKPLGDSPGGGITPESANCSTNPTLCYGGGGGGGGTTTPPEQKRCNPMPTCDYTSQNFDADQCQCISACAKPGQVKYSGECVSPCQTGYDRDANGQCACPSGSAPDGSKGCACSGPNEEFVGGECKTKCTGNQERVNGACLEKCTADQERVGQDCLPKCPTNYERIDNYCTPVCTKCQYRDTQTKACVSVPNCTL